MQKMTSTLPPKVFGEVEGRLDILVLRPVLVPTLQPSQALDFFISWWGDDKHSVVRLLPNIGEVKFVFNICSDINRFQKYLDDAEEVVLEVFISDGDKSVQHSSPERLLRKNKKEWKNGEYIGSFQIKDIKLNSRGEFVYEGNICNKYGEVCGSLVVFMLYTTKYNLELDTESYFSSPENENKKLTISLSSTNQILELSSNAPSALDVTSFECEHSTSSECNTFQSPSNKNVEQEQHCDHKFEQSYISETDLLEYLPDKGILITRLFSFVDSGAIQLSDVPTLLQICQERSSPQLDLGTIQSGIKLPPEFIGSSNVSLNTKNDVGGNYKKLITADSRAIPLSDRSFRKIPGKSNAVENSNEENSQVNLSPKLLNNSNCDSHDKSEKLTSDASLIIISVATINLKPFDKKDISQETKLKSSKLSNFLKKIVVRQRSKICYFLQISVFDHKNSEDTKTTLLVSRQIENGVIFFHKKEILPLPNRNFTEELKGYMKVRVIRRKLGERLGTEIGIGLVSLKNLYTIRDKNAQLKLWLPNKENCNESHQTIGKLEFSVVFALLSDVYPSLNLDDSDKKGVFRHSLSDINDNVNLRLSSKNNDSESENQERHSSVDADFCCPLQQFNGYKGRLEYKCGEKDSKIFPLEENKEEKELEVSYTHHWNPHTEDVFLENYKTSRRKLFDQKSLNLSDATSPQSCCKVTKKYDAPSDECSSMEANFGVLLQKKYLNKDQSAQEFDNGHSILFAEVSSSLRQSLGSEMNCKVLLEIIEGRNFPMLLSCRSDFSFAPNTYVRISLKSVEYETYVIKNTVSPKWNFRTSMEINREDFIQTNDHFFLLVFHSRNGVSSGADDPILGFVALDIQLLWTSVISLSGWVPVLNKEQSICGEINITLTSLKFILTDSREVTKADMTSDINSPKESAADSKESSTQTSQIWCKSLFRNHPHLDCHTGDSFPKDFKHCNVNENMLPSLCRPVLFKEMYDINLTSNMDVFQPEVNKPVSPVNNETFIISRSNEWIDSDEVEQSTRFDSLQSEKLNPNSLTKIDKSSDTTKEKHPLKSLPVPKSPNSNVEAFTWRNQLKCLDTPCASYIDFRPYNDSLHNTLSIDKENSNLPLVKEAVHTKQKRIKCRIAANINMPKFV